MATKPTKTSTVKAKAADQTTSAPKISRARKSDTELDAAPAPAEVAQRAYERFIARGQQHGHDVEDWLSAERELSQPR
jgi:hypothetical protein